ncbi:MAG: LysR family transcriptional regulator [Parasporobacterium sp.]|nr:LysR family transcriptional regulator [Parasporobacterium sp.]
MDYQRIKYFLEAAQCLNFSRAAKNLYITPQSFGKQIAILEEEMGVQLFDRSTRKVKLTSKGSEIYERLSYLVEGLEKEYEKILSELHVKNDELNIGFYGSMRQDTIASPIVANLMANFPEYDFNIRLMELKELSKGLENGSLDLVITITKDTDKFWKNCEKMLIKSYEAQVVVSLYHKWNAKEKITKEDMMEYPCVSIDIPDIYNDKTFKKIPCKGIVVAPNYETLLIMLQQGRSFCILNEEFDKTDYRKLRAFKMPCDSFNFNLTLMYSKNNKKSDLAKVAKSIKEEFEG